jgi:L-malate glycosyltransferase
MPPLRVLYLTDNPNLGASVRVVRDWVQMQEQANVRFHFGLAADGPLAGWVRDKGVPHSLAPMPWFGRRGAIRSTLAAARLAARARRWGIDIVHSEHNVYPFAVVVAALLRRPVICGVHFVLDRAFVEWAFAGWRKPSHVLWTSRSQQQDCREALAGIVPDDRQSVIPLGVNLDTFGNDGGGRDALRASWGATADTIVVGAANAIRPGKRVQDFLELIRQLRLRDPRVLGAIAGTPSPGDEAYASEMRQLTTTLGLDTGCLWLGNLEPVEPFLHAIDVFVSTSCYESFGMSIVEAMACRRPVAVYRAGAPGEIVGDAGLVAETEDLPALVAAVEQLVASDSLRASLGQQGRARVEAKFSPRVSLQALTDLYRRLIAERAAGAH